MEELFEVPGAEPVADRLQPGRVVAGGEPVGQLREPDPGPSGLLLGPLMPVDPDLQRIREVGADLDERGPEPVVPQIEVIAGDPPVGLVEAEPESAVIGPLGSGEHILVLLRHPDRRDP